MQTADKCESVFRTNSGRSDEINGIGEMYNRFAMFYQQYHGIQGIVQSQTNDERIILTSILRGMKFGSANARLQFQSILELPKVVDMQLAGDFEEEVGDDVLSTDIFLTLISTNSSRCMRCPNGCSSLGYLRLWLASRLNRHVSLTTWWSV